LEAEFVVSANQPEQFPSDQLPEISFLGRSNVGKSSLINALIGQRKLAFTSSTPGRTQTINFYRIERRTYFVDLPGYGYARVPKGFQNQWKELIDQYLENRPTLVLSFVVLDARRAWMEKDLGLKEWLESQNRQYLVIVTKMDKLNQADQQRSLAAVSKIVPDPLPFSAVTGRGVREIWQAITKTRQLK
jgi:GTP-binding protein